MQKHGHCRGKESACNAEDPGSIAWVGKIPWKRDRLSITEEENYLSPLVGSVVCGYLLSSPSKGNSVKGSEPFERWLEGPCSFLVWGGVELAEGGGREVRLNRNCRKRQWQATPVLLPRKSHGWRSLVGYRPWGREELDTTERLSTAQHAKEAKQM